MVTILGAIGFVFVLVLGGVFGWVLAEVVCEHEEGCPWC